MKRKNLIIIILVLLGVIVTASIYLWVRERGVRDERIPVSQAELEVYSKYESDPEQVVGRFVYTDEGFDPVRMGFEAPKPPVALIPNFSDAPLQLYYSVGPPEVQSVEIPVIVPGGVGEVVFEVPGRYILRNEANFDENIEVEWRYEE